MKQAEVFLATIGLNTKIDPVRTAGDPSKVVLTSCLNVAVDDTGRLSRRKGRTLWLAGSWHSLYPCGEYMLGVKGDALSVIQGKASTPIRNVSGEKRMRYQTAWDGKKEVVYYTNGSESGKVYGGVSYPITLPEYVGPETSKELTVMPSGVRDIQLWNGRLFVAVDKTVWYSEPFNYDSFNPACGFMMFESDVFMILPTQSGMMIGTASNIVFLQGNSTEEFQFVKVADYGVLEGNTGAQYQGELSLGESMTYRPWFFGSKKGICVLTQAGQMLNVTDKKVPYPEALRGSGGFVGDKYILNLEG